MCWGIGVWACRVSWVSVRTLISEAFSLHVEAPTSSRAGVSVWTVKLNPMSYPGRALGHFIFSLVGLKRILFTNIFQRL